jgi:Mn2+/Fe2+ NRAMP family transporter
VASGSIASILFAAGFIGTGLLAVPALAGSAATAIAGLRGKRWGFADRPSQAPTFYVLVAIGTLGGTVLGLVYTDPIGLLVASGIINGIAAAPFMVLALLIARDRTLMKGAKIGRTSTTLGWVAVAAMGIAGAFGVVTL